MASAKASAAPKAPLLNVSGKSSKRIELDESVFGAELRPHLIHETVRHEFGAARAGTKGAKSRGQVRGGGAKPWRQKGTGRARQGTTNAVQFTGGGVVFPPTMRSFGGKVNRKVRAGALRSALSAHVSRGSMAVVDAEKFDEPSTKKAVTMLDGWTADRPVLVVCESSEDAVAKSFRNIARVSVTGPGELEVRHLVGARSVLVTTSALETVSGRAG